MATQHYIAAIRTEHYKQKQSNYAVSRSQNGKNGVQIELKVSTTLTPKLPL
jgi:hypothetical protein